MKKILILGHDENGKAITHKHRDKPNSKEPMTTQPQNNDLRRKAAEMLHKHIEQLITDGGLEGFQISNLPLVREYNSILDAMLEFHQEQQLEKLKEALLRIANGTEIDDIFESDREIAAQALNSLKENK